MMNECLIWDKSLNTYGYGQTFIDGKIKKAHRVAWEMLYGPIPEGFVVDHMCHNEAASKGECEGGACKHRACYNPNHLRVVTQRQNTLAGLHAIDTRGGFKCGHEMIEKNITVRGGNRRECAECSRQRASAYYYAKVRTS